MPVNPMPRRTKIVCTIGPASSSEQTLRDLIIAGMNVARLNFSHGTHEEHARVIERVRSIANALDKPIAILQDLAGPKVRLGKFRAGAVELTEGGSFTLTTVDVDGDEARASVSYEKLPSEVKPGDILLLADGSITLEVVEVKAEEVRCRVVVGGSLSSRKGVNVPSGLFGLPILRERDLADLHFGIREGVDYVGLSFVRTGNDVAAAKREIAGAGGDAPVIAKIETSAALQHMEEILQEADGLMIARGDLSIETPFARVPIVQKQLIAKANAAAKPVITATQMLFSMVASPYPTRAEAADVANAVLDGSDAVMLSDETTIGKYPVRAVETMASIVCEAERGATVPAVAGAQQDDSGVADDEALARGACELASRIGADVIATLTATGRTARLVAKCRPCQPILAASDRVGTYRRLALVRDVSPIMVPSSVRTREEMLAVARAALEAQGYREKRAVFVASDAVIIAKL